MAEALVLSLQQGESRPCEALHGPRNGLHGPRRLISHPPQVQATQSLLRPP